MGRLCKLLALILLFMAGQQGSVVHDLSHLAGVGPQGNNIDAGLAEGAPCVLCPAFAQAGAAAFGHSFHFPTLYRAAAPDSSAAPRELIGTSTPRPRSRGPPV
jgi:hypothetical protein